MSAKKVNRLDFYLALAILAVLGLSAFNIHSFLTPSKVEVLGVNTEEENKEFWLDFLDQNPEYIPGWLELDREDKATEIDPNHITP